MNGFSLAASNGGPYSISGEEKIGNAMLPQTRQFIQQ
jgi:hypothetical protein